MHRSRWWSVVVVFLLLGSFGSTFVLTDVAATPQTTQSEDWGTNALVIKYVGESASDPFSYTVGFTGKVHMIDNEYEDSVYKNYSATGEVSSSDRTDTIRYSGDIKRIVGNVGEAPVRFYGLC